MSVFTKEAQAQLTPDQALEILVNGNKRFLAGQKNERDLLEQARLTKDGQHPHSVILSCIDSRTSSELIFDQGIGDIFSVRIAGNIVNEDILGSMEFSCKLAGTKLIVVLGHTACGAVKGACDHAKLGNLTTLLSKLEGSVESETTETDRNSGNASFVRKVTDINIRNMVNEILEKSPVLKEMVDKKEIGIIGGIHDIATGEVTFYEDTKK